MKANLSLDCSENVKQEEMNQFYLVELLPSRSNSLTGDRCQGLEPTPRTPSTLPMAQDPISALGPSALVPGMLQHGQSPAPHNPARPAQPWPHILAPWMYPMPGAGAALLLPSQPGGSPIAPGPAGTLTISPTSSSTHNTTYPTASNTYSK